MKALRAISLWQPWASLMAFNQKMVETRGRKTNVRGWVGIHAAQKLGPENRPYFIEEPFRAALLSGAAKMPAGWRCDPCPRGVIVAVGKLVGCYEVGGPGARPLAKCQEWMMGRFDPQSLTYKERAFGDYTPGRWGWVFEQIVILSAPAQAKAGQGWFYWTPPGWVFEQVPAARASLVEIL